LPEDFVACLKLVKSIWNKLRLWYVYDMKSNITDHFPQFIFKEGKKYLWNPITKRTHEIRPEEKVRLRTLEFLIHGLGWPASRIASEAKIDHAPTAQTLRADLIAYSKEMKPEILVECKAESVKLNEAAAVQTARYNTTVKASVMLITNGLEDFWIRFNGEGAEVLKESPYPVKPASELHQDIEYWQKRGFAGNKVDGTLKEWMVKAISLFWSDEQPWSHRYLDLKYQLRELQPDHYYRLIQMDDDTRLAIGFVGADSGKSYLISILNKNQQNTGLLVISLDDVAAGNTENSSLLSINTEEKMDIRKHVPLDMNNWNPSIIENLPGFIARFFDKKLSL